MSDSTTPAPDRPAAATPTLRARPRSALLRWGLGLLAAAASLLGLAALTLGALVLLSSQDAPSRWLLQQAPGVQAEGVQGALAGPSLSVARLRLALPGGGRLEVEDLRLENPRWTLVPHPGAWVGLSLTSLSARRVQGWPGTVPADPKPTPPPDSLRLPLRLQAEAVAVDSLQWNDGAPMLGLRGALALGEAQGAQHRLEVSALTLQGVLGSGALSIATDAPLALRAQLRAAPATPATPAASSASAPSAPSAAAPAWQAEASAQGPLQDLAVQASARAGDGGSAVLSLQTRVRPFARWPLAQLALSTRDLDLATLWPGAPRTALAGRVTLDTGGLDAPAQLALTLDNALPGRVDENRLPLQRVDVRAEAVPRQPQRLVLSRFEGQWADRAGPHGTLRGQGEWGPQGLTLDTRWQGVQAQRVDARAAAVRVDGNFKLDATGLPTPNAMATADAAARVARATWRWTADLQGQPAPGRGPAPPRLSLQAQGQWQAGVGELTQLRAEAGGARLQADGRVALPAAGALARLQARSRGELKDFDPAVWWAGPAAAPWQRGAQRLSAQWAADVSLPWPWTGALAAWRGASGSLTLQAPDNRWAGQPLDVQAELGLGPAAGDAAGARLRLDLRAGDNTLQARLSGEGADRLTLAGDVTLAAPKPAALAPWMAPWPALAAAWPRAGQAEGRATVAGRWPALRSEGQLQASDLSSARGSLGQARARWQIGSEANAPLEVSLQLSELRLDAVRVPRVDLQLQGTAAEHRATWLAEAPLRPPPVLRQALGRAESPGLRLAGELRGGWLSSGPSLWPAQGWRGQVRALQVADLPVAAGEGRTPATAAKRGTVSSGPWFALQPASDEGVAVELALAEDGTLRSLRVQAGAARVADTATLRWEALALQAAPGSAARWQARATVDPVAVAPLLDRLQPEIRWSGDLRMRARLAVDAGERFATEVVLEREAGDLSIGRDTLEGGNLPLGLSDLRLAVTAQDGTWYFTQAFAGTRLGELAGAQSVSTQPEARWPGPESPLDGVLQGRVANLGVWGAWVPPGWRLSGSLQSTASFGGRFGAPEVTGSLVGQNLGARQVLQGIAVSDGELRVALEGERARIETLRLRAGDGEVRVQGGATLGAAPRADLTLVAERFRVLGRVDRRLVVSGDARLGLTRDSLKLDGAFTVDEGLVDFSRGDAPALDGDVNVIRADAPPREDEAAAAAPPEALRRAEVALTLNLGERLRVVGRGLQTRLRGDLAFSLPGGRPQLRGTVRAEDGQYAAYGQKLEITRGEVRFTGAPDNPQLDILAIRPNLDVTVGVSITGAARSPRIRLTSDPELAEYDKLSWLVLGRAPDGLGRTDTALLQRAAVALLAGESEGNAVTDPLLGALSLDDLSVRQTEGEVRETILSLGKQLSRRWYVGYERSVNATTGTWQLIYRAAQRFTLRAQSGEDSSLDVIWTWRWGP